MLLITENMCCFCGKIEAFYENNSKINIKEILGRTTTIKTLHLSLGIIKENNYQNGNEIQNHSGSVDFVGNKLIFNIGGNHYRLTVSINYHHQIVYILFIGTHKQYDEINVNEL